MDSEKYYMPKKSIPKPVINDKYQATPEQKAYRKLAKKWGNEIREQRKEKKKGNHDTGTPI